MEVAIPKETGDVESVQETRGMEKEKEEKKEKKERKERKGDNALVILPLVL